MKQTERHRPWVNFKELRARLRFEDVLRHYKVEVRAKGGQHLGPCPLPNHNASRTALSFSASLDRGIFQCFGCKAKGNVLEFAGMMSNVDLADGNALRDVALELQQKLLGPDKAECNVPTAPPAQREFGEALVNPPLDFALKGLDATHPFFRWAKLGAETVAEFGLGYCSRGVLNGRIAIPLHSATGEMVGYAGASPNGGSPEAERYSFPSDRTKSGVSVLFRKEEFVYNGHRIKGPHDDLVVVEWFSSAWWLHQCGYREVVALMQSACSERQAEQIASLVSPKGRIWLLREAECGPSATEAIVVRLSALRFVRMVEIGGRERIARTPSDQIRQLFA